jgi:hypothetical protein
MINGPCPRMFERNNYVASYGLRVSSFGLTPYYLPAYPAYRRQAQVGDLRLTIRKNVMRRYNRKYLITPVSTYASVWRRAGQVERILLLNIFRGPLRGHTLNIETNSFPSGSGSSHLFRLILFRGIYRLNKI